MAVTIAGVSTLGVQLSYGIEQTAGQKPTVFKLLPKVNSIYGIGLDTEAIDGSALEDGAERSISGKQSTGGKWGFDFNFTSETKPIYKALLNTSKAALASGMRTWFQISISNLDESFFVVAQPGTKTPFPDVGQNELLVASISCSIDEYEEMDVKIVPRDSSIKSYITTRSGKYLTTRSGNKIIICIY